jgi:hypothetical protein
MNVGTDPELLSWLLSWLQRERDDAELDRVGCSKLIQLLLYF